MRLFYTVLVKNDTIILWKSQFVKLRLLDPFFRLVIGGEMGKSNQVLSADEFAQRGKEFYYLKGYQEILQEIHQLQRDGWQKQNLIQLLEILMAQKKLVENEQAIALFFHIRQLEQKEHAEREFLIYVEIVGIEERAKKAYLESCLKGLELVSAKLKQEIQLLDKEIQRLNIEYKKNEDELIKIMTELFKECLPEHLKETLKGQKMTESFSYQYTLELRKFKESQKDYAQANQDLASIISANVYKEANLIESEAATSHDKFMTNVVATPVRKMVDVLQTKRDEIKEDENIKQIKEDKLNAVTSLMAQFKEELERLSPQPAPVQAVPERKREEKHEQKHEEKYSNNNLQHARHTPAVDTEQPAPHNNHNGSTATMVLLFGAKKTFAVASAKEEQELNPTEESKHNHSQAVSSTNSSEKKDSIPVIEDQKKPSEAVSSTDLDSSLIETFSDEEETDTVKEEHSIKPGCSG